MVYREKPKELKFSVSSETELTNIWDFQAQYNSILWSRKDDKLEIKNDKRNYKIEQLRDKFLSKTKGRQHNYERREDYPYISEEHRQQFFKTVEAEGLTKSEEITQKKLYNTDGYYHNVSIPKKRVEAKLYIEKLHPGEIEEKYSLGLGGMEVDWL